MGQVMEEVYSRWKILEWCLLPFVAGNLKVRNPVLQRVQEMTYEQMKSRRDPEAN